ncbi:type II toxin-antitoxin system RelE/ParE family toxin [Polynucleobacter brandtiae]|uniref:Proteic killer suppression protein n=1 Tax=Polynucleobacter brandtiae TaxID=1938816 RepID=A0A2M8VR27_9BURK|nr:type II toxin-antitoxin system RelE/ParE family toxin [Polynucleobacter brandtiae]PJI79897.1 proteic killer suppression protein [Polynucleobacter brandtiae]
MITSFAHKGLESFFIKGSYKAIPAQFGTRIERILDRLDSAIMHEDMDLPGFKFHELKGKRRGVYSVTVSGNWRITFQFDGDSAVEVDLEDYH